jgi:hypothetical protein
MGSGSRPVGERQAARATTLLTIPPYRDVASKYPDVVAQIETYLKTARTDSPIGQSSRSLKFPVSSENDWEL